MGQVPPDRDLSASRARRRSVLSSAEPTPTHGGRTLDSKKIALELTVDEINLILQALGQLPYAQVFGLVARIHEQSRQQLEAPAGPRSPAPPSR